MEIQTKGILGGCIAVVSIIGFAAYLFWTNIGSTDFYPHQPDINFDFIKKPILSFLSNNWIKSITFLRNDFVWIVGVIMIAFILTIIYFFTRSHKEKTQKFESRLNEINPRECHSNEAIKEASQTIDKIVKGNPRLAKKFHHQIEVLEQGLKIRKKHLEKKQKKQKQKEKQERKYEQELRKERWRETNKTEKLIKYFDKQKSNKAIPKWATRFSTEVVEQAQREYDELVENREWDKKKWQEAVKFVSTYQAYPIDFNEMDYYERHFYKKALRLHKKGKLPQIKETENPKPLEEKQEALDEDKKLVSKRFYYADELSYQEKEKLIRKYGYKNKPFIFRDGSSGNNLVIKNDGQSESDYHFCMKHLFAEIDDRTKIEYQIGNFKADVAIIGEQKKLAIEIETGTNKEEQIANKVKWLNQHFDNWIFICSRKHTGHYRKYINNEQNFCLTLKQANEKVLELLKELS